MSPVIPWICFHRLPADVLLGGDERLVARRQAGQRRGGGRLALRPSLDLIGEHAMVGAEVLAELVVVGVHGSGDGVHERRGGLAGADLGLVHLLGDVLQLVHDRVADRAEALQGEVEPVAHGVGGHRLHLGHQLVGVDEAEPAGEDVDAAAACADRRHLDAGEADVLLRVPHREVAHGVVAGLLALVGGRSRSRDGAERAGPVAVHLAPGVGVGPGANHREQEPREEQRQGAVDEWQSVHGGLLG